MSTPDDFDSLFSSESGADALPEDPSGAPEGAGNPFEAPGGALGSNPFEEGSGGATRMDLDLAFSVSVLHGGRKAIREAVGLGVTPERLQGDGRRVFEFALEHLAQYGSCPTTDQVLARLALVLPDTPPSGPSAFWASEVLNRGLHGEMQSGLERWTGLLEQRKAADAFADLREWAREQSLRYAKVTADPFTSHLAAVKERYLRRKAGETGILTPWPTINELTYGLYPEQVWLLVARSGVGKTWAMLAMALCAWRAGKRVLFATTEMAQIAIVHRFVAMLLNLPYSFFNKGKLPLHLEAKFLECCDTLQDDKRLYLVGGDFDFKPESYEAAIEKIEPEISFLDGAYLMVGKGKTRTEMAADAFNEVQRIGRRQKVAQVLSSQLNRDAKADDAKSGAQEKVALTDAAVWNATVLLGLAQTKDMRRDRIAQAKLLKNREGPLGDTMTFNWDFDRMDFTEQKPESETPDEDFGTGVDGPAPPIEGGDPFATLATSLSDTSPAPF